MAAKATYIGIWQKKQGEIIVHLFACDLHHERLAGKPYKTESRRLTDGEQRTRKPRCNFCDGWDPR